MQSGRLFVHAVDRAERPALSGHRGIEQSVEVGADDAGNVPSGDLLDGRRRREPLVDLLHGGEQPPAFVLALVVLADGRQQPDAAVLGSDVRELEILHARVAGFLRQLPRQFARAGRRRRGAHRPDGKQIRADTGTTRRSVNASSRSFGSDVVANAGTTDRRLRVGGRSPSDSRIVSCPGTRYSTGVTNDCGRSFVWFWYSASRAAVERAVDAARIRPASSSP